MTIRKFSLLAAGALALGSMAALAVGFNTAPEQAVGRAAPKTEAEPAKAASETMTLNLDSAHSSVIFAIKHMGVANFYGRFNSVDGSMSWNEESPEESSIAITIAAESVDSNNDRRDQHLRSPDFFTAREFPEIKFQSTSIEADGENYTVKGDLTMNGATKPLTVPLTKTGQATQPRSGNAVLGFESIFTLKRSEWNINYGIENGALADDVKMIFSLEMVAE